MADHLHPVHQANASSPYGSLSRHEFYLKHRILHQESFFPGRLTNSTLFTQSWRPAPPSTVRGVVAMLHGYVAESSSLFELTAVAFARLGFLAVSLDYPGHGRSSGSRGYLPSSSLLVSDVISFFDSFIAGALDLPAFLYGESLGGAIAVLIAAEQRQKWRGLVLNAPLCGVAARFKPPWPLELLLPAVAAVTPWWRVVVTKNPVDASYKEKWKRKLLRRSPSAQRLEHPPAATARQLLRLCEEVQRRGEEVEAAVLVVHGGDDGVCDVAAAAEFFRAAKSADKTMRVLPGVWHMLVGEPEETVEKGFGIIFERGIHDGSMRKAVLLAPPSVLFDDGWTDGVQLKEIVDFEDLEQIHRRFSSLGEQDSRHLTDIDADILTRD
ncbi:hypothetical protein AXF42_Ash019190 [Apostasia shenzhenica]|uniref:Serine aminopeptidase S33 domain-containing protein n=1 Tax=Apostasia shenzhenica TaxID=1088818 RepID=A0A2I0B2H9_9ASPA|nr:hypothetical protein AXF42_Ash019190 [Apostasia shenzhenica]